MQSKPSVLRSSITHENGVLGELLGLFKIKALNEGVIKPRESDEAITSLK